MKIIISLAFIPLLLLSGIYKTQSQTLTPLNSIKDIEALKESEKGKVLLINFWATWCKPCVAEFPDLVKLYKDYKDKGFELVFISLDMTDDVQTKVVPFLDQHGVDFTTYYNNFDKPEELINYIDKNWEGAIPATYIYDKSGNLTANSIGRKGYEYFEKEIVKDMD